jgi:hypothetical protein
MKAIAFAVFLMLVILAAAYQNYETFADSVRRTVLTTGFNNNSIWVIGAGKGAWIPKKSTEADVLNASVGSLIVSYTTDAQVVGTVLAQQKGYFVSVSSPQLAFRLDCGFDLGGLTVGYFDRADLAFINALILGYRMDPTKINLKRVEFTQALDYRLSVAGDLDLVITFLIPLSPFHRLLQTQRISVMGFKLLDIERIKVFEPSINMEAVQLRTLFFDDKANASTVMSRENDTMLPFMYARVISVTAPVISVLDTFVTNLETDPRTTDPTYRCYGDSTVDIRALCESTFDVMGQPKKTPTVWDQPCMVDTNCPFWDPSQGRGGCNPKDGLCELPVAVKRLGYRKYNASGVYAPFTRNEKYIFASSNRNG